MQITIEDISPVEKRVEFEVPWPEVAAKLDKAYDKLRREVRLKGFRPGKVPRQVVEKLYKTRVEDEVARDVVSTAITQAVQEKQIAPIAPPTVDKLELKHGEALKFSTRVEVRSQVTPKDYAGIRVSRRPAKVTEEQIDKALEGYQRKFTVFKPVEDREQTAADDVLTADVHGKIGDHKIKTRTISVDLSDENAVGVPGLAERLRGVPVNAQGLEIKYRPRRRSRAWPARRSAFVSRSRRSAVARYRRSTTSWPRTAVRPIPSPNCASRCAESLSRRKLSASSAKCPPP